MHEDFIQGCPKYVLYHIFYSRLFILKVVLISFHKEKNRGFLFDRRLTGWRSGTCFSCQEYMIGDGDQYLAAEAQALVGDQENLSS